MFKFKVGDIVKISPDYQFYPSKHYPENVTYEIKSLLPNKYRADDGDFNGYILKGFNGDCWGKMPEKYLVLFKWPEQKKLKLKDFIK